MKIPEKETASADRALAALLQPVFRESRLVVTPHQKLLASK